MQLMVMATVSTTANNHLACFFILYPPKICFVELLPVPPHPGGPPNSPPKPSTVPRRIPVIRAAAGSMEHTGGLSRDRSRGALRSRSIGSLPAPVFSISGCIFTERIAHPATNCKPGDNKSPGPRAAGCAENRFCQRGSARFPGHHHKAAVLRVVAAGAESDELVAVFRGGAGVIAGALFDV